MNISVSLCSRSQEGNVVKISKYVKQIDFNSENFLLRNLFNGAIYLIPKNDYCQIQESLRNGSEIMACHREALVQELFIVEKDPVPQFNRQADSFLITVETTSLCNLQCSYCYENDKGTRKNISEAVISDLLQYIKNVFLLDTMHKWLCVGFIGGEPLLYKESIFYIVEKITDLGKQYGRGVSFHIDTNGTIPFDDIYRSINNLHISVSLTPRDDHNKNRCGKGFDSFNCINTNLKNVIRKEGNSLSIRYNTNDENINNFQSFVSYVKKEIPICDTIEPMYTDEYEYTRFNNKLSLDKFRNWNSSEAIDILIDNGYRIPYSLGGVLAPCIAYQEYSCKVYADGMVTLCDSMFHKDARCNISDICNNPDMLEKYFSEFKKYNPLEDKECRNCIDLARCMGKLFCRTDKCDHNKRFNDDLLACTFTKYFLEGKESYFFGML